MEGGEVERQFCEERKINKKEVDYHRGSMPRDALERVGVDAAQIALLFIAKVG